MKTKQFVFSYLKFCLSNKDWDKIARVKEKLNTMINEDMLGVVIRSRFNQNVEEENASLFHAGRECKNAKNDINKLKVGNSMIEDPVTIEREVTSFFGALFNGFHDTNLHDTGRSFVPDQKFKNEFLGNLGHLNGQDSLNLV